jgi:cobalt/nickel transport system permease protein
MENEIPSFLLNPEDQTISSYRRGRWRPAFIDVTLRHAAGIVRSIRLQADNSSKNTFVGKINPYIKVISFIYLIVIISIVNSLLSQLLVTFFILLLYVLARVNIIQVYRKILLAVFFFGFLVFLPATLNVITPGHIIFQLISFRQPHQFWIYHIPQHIGITLEGSRIAGLLLLRVFNSVSLTLLVVYSTSLPGLLKAFRIFLVPVTFLMAVTLAYKYILILSETVGDTYRAMKSRLIQRIPGKAVRELTGGRVFFIFKHSQILYEMSYHAMISRGYDGKINLIDYRKPGLWDGVALAVVIIFGIGVILI